MGRGVLILAAIAALLPASARATLVMTGDSTTVRGQVGLTVYASANLTKIEGGELVDGVYRPLVDFSLQNAGIIPPVGAMVVGTHPDVSAWQCDRRNREFVAVGWDAFGNTETARFSVRTPSCRHRFRVQVTPRARPGAKVTVIVRDSWRAGGIDMRLCRRPPHQRSRCQTLAMPQGVDAVSSAFRVPDVGRWRVNLGAATQRETRVVSVGVRPRPEDLALLPGVMTTGDSMMQTLDTVLDDRLSGRAELISDVHIGAGLTKPYIVDWDTLPTRQVRMEHPRAVVVFLGANETAPLQAPNGGLLPCCRSAWIAEYARRTRAIMRTYLQGGEGAVVWLKNPVPGDVRRKRSMAAVNKAVEQAANGLGRVRLLDLAAVFTPGGEYRDSISYDGRMVRVRQDDEIHLTIAGARIASRAVLDALVDLGVI